MHIVNEKRSKKNGNANVKQENLADDIFLWAYYDPQNMTVILLRIFYVREMVLGAAIPSNTLICLFLLSS